MPINLAKLESAFAVQTDKGVFAVGPHPADPQRRPLVMLYLSYHYAQSVADSLNYKSEGRTKATPVYIAEIESLRRFVGAFDAQGCTMVIVEGDDEITDQVERTPSDLLAELPAGKQYGFAYEFTGAERFDPGEITITPGVHSTLGARVGEVVQELLSRHLTGDYGDSKLKEPQGPGLKSDWELNDERVASSDEPYVMSVYSGAGGTGKKVWIISQYGYTTVLLPSEY
jgi:hypothetical protein